MGTKKALSLIREGFSLYGTETKEERVLPFAQSSLPLTCGLKKSGSHKARANLRNFVFSSFHYVFSIILGWMLLSFQSPEIDSRT
jgi:hypothetical protein